jgi:hypothetical protein
VFATCQSGIFAAVRHIFSFMKRIGHLGIVLCANLPLAGIAQCSICTKTASQLGRNSAEGLNGGIIYLMLIPFLIMAFVGIRWWRQERRVRAQEAATVGATTKVF